MIRHPLNAVVIPFVSSSSLSSGSIQAHLCSITTQQTVSWHTKNKKQVMGSISESMPNVFTLLIKTASRPLNEEFLLTTFCELVFLRWRDRRMDRNSSGTLGKYPGSPPGSDFCFFLFLALLPGLHFHTATPASFCPNALSLVSLHCSHLSPGHCFLVWWGIVVFTVESSLSQCFIFILTV